uniref:Abnormal spindle microtubule assembly n=1 Tax=Sinocyclocheilus rhinocerous TaxID=307959 RepID=A0A673NFX1_9TELE
MSFRTYTARQRLNRLRRAACKLFTSDTMVKAIQRLELEVEAKRLLVRKDRHLWKDIGERQKVLNWLISYNPLWLRIGLETIYGELISLESNSDVMGLAMFILGRLLWNPDLAAEFRHPKVPHLYRDGHEEALSRFTLKKLILLVCFLDKAKESRLIEHDPCLFCMDAEFKSSKDLLLAFSRDFLSGEGILSRHLSHLGLDVSHVQTPLDEFNFAVKNLAVDLRCGIRLVRVMELFTLDWTLSRKLRIPAISRLQKVHNVDVALQVLKDKGVDLRDEHGANIDSRDIVDGHREKTLNLLWKIIFAFQVEVLLDENQLKEEISFLRKTWRTKRKLASLMANSGIAVTRMKARQAFEHPSQKVTLLMDWISAVCEFYSLKAENFTVSFSDGRILCYLIHHYHPGHLPAEEIQQRTTQTIECGHRGRVELNNSSTDSDCSFENLELLENERSNFQLVNTAVSYLGGVPAMINPEDMSNTIPNEKVVMCYLSFLCTRLLDLRNETRAARVIQGAWRRYKLQKDIEIIQVRNLAATKIQAVVRKFIMRRRMIQQNKAANRIQTFWRGCVAREKLRVLKKEKQFALQNAAATVIQVFSRRYLRQEYMALKLASVTIQAIWQGRAERRKISQLHRFAKIIQLNYRRYVAQTRFLEMKRAAIVIQRQYTAFRDGRKVYAEYTEMKRAAIVLQSAYRGKKARQELQKKNKAATLIQSVIRQRHRAFTLGRLERSHYVHLRQATVTLQAIYRGSKVRQNLRQEHQAATIIQSQFRMHKVRIAFLAAKCAAIIIQQQYRAYRVGKCMQATYLQMKNAAVVIQSAFRGMKVRSYLRKSHQAATVIQALWRGHCSRKHHDTSKVISMRRRLRKVNQRVKEEDKLCNKTTTALSYLLGLQNYAYILAALKHLDTATRLSPECCERLVESGATHTIFTLIRSCNRSVPSMEIITLSIQVLLNLSKYNRTIDAVYDVDSSVETLLELLQIYREKAGDKVAEKGGSIFTKACFLLVLLVQDERRAMEVRKLPKVSDRIRSIYRLTLRKYKMDAERNKVKQKMNTSLNGSFLLQATPRKSKPVARFAPDWVLRRDKLKDIVDPLRAIQMLANALAIVP